MGYNSAIQSVENVTMGYNSAIQSVENVTMGYNSAIQSVENVTMGYNSAIQSVENVTMGYNSAIQSVENVTKAVMRLPRFMRSNFYQDFKDSTYNNNDLKLDYFEKWLANRLSEMLNPIAAIIETKNKDNKYNRQQHRIFQMSGNNSNTNKKQFNLKCSTIIKFHFAQKLKIHRTLIKSKLLKIKNSVSIVYQILT